MRLTHRNYYRCPSCDITWEDNWDSEAEDDCPECGCRHIQPEETELLEE